MIESDNTTLALIVVLAVSWMVAAFRVRGMARGYGRSPNRWFLVTILFSALPATIVFWLDYRNKLSARSQLSRFHRQRRIDPQRCPHCGKLIDPPEESDNCPHCKLRIDEGNMA